VWWVCSDSHLLRDNEKVDAEAIELDHNSFLDKAQAVVAAVVDEVDDGEAVLTPVRARSPDSKL